MFSYRTPKCFEGEQIVIYQNIFPDDMIIIEVSIYQDGHAFFLTSWKNMLLLL